MIRVTIELLPHGFETDKETLGVVEIANDGTGTLTNGSYRYKLFKRGMKGIWKSGGVSGFPRQKLGSYDLLYRVLKAAIGNRNI